MRLSKEQILSHAASGVLRISPAGGKVKTSPFQPAGLFLRPSPVSSPLIGRKGEFAFLAEPHKQL